MQLEWLWHDFRVALRQLRKSPAATALSVLSIALGIGLTTGVFSVADAMFLRPFPFARPAELRELYSLADDGHPLRYGWLDYQDLSKAVDGLGSLVAYERQSAMLAGPEESQFVLTHAVTPNYFEVLGVKAQLGTATVEDLDVTWSARRRCWRLLWWPRGCRRDGRPAWTR